MADFQFNKGDIVRLKSGSPSMTVVGCSNQNGEVAVKCVWFDDQQHPQRAAFPEQSLESDE